VFIGVVGIKLFSSIGSSQGQALAEAGTRTIAIIIVAINRPISLVLFIFLIFTSPFYFYISSVILMTIKGLLVIFRIFGGYSNKKE